VNVLFTAFFIQKGLIFAILKTMKIAVLISGGVDSSVALRLLKQQGHDLTAFYLKIWLEDELSFLGNCPWEEDLSYVREVCKQVNVPLEVVSMQRAYWDQVVAYTIDQVRRGFTPNPDMLCNQRVKFGAFYDHIGTEFDKIATGHYAQVAEHDGLFVLKQSPDTIKDQTYFLAQLSQEQMSRALFPIGHLEKAQVRDYAQQFNLPNQARKDSQGICFLGKLKFDEFIAYHLGEKPGAIIEVETGKNLGTHRGFWFHTIGQRQGLGLSGGPWYVVQKDTDNNIVFVSRSYHAADKSRDSFMVGNCNWISGVAPTATELGVKLRHGPALYAAMVAYLTDDTLRVKLPQNDQGIAPGQFAVFYDNGVCLGSGQIVPEKLDSL